MFEKILVPLDGSKLSEIALVYAKELAAAFDSEVHLLGVCEDRDEKHRRLIQAYVEKTADELRREIAAETDGVKPAILDGEPAARIVDYGRKKRMDLIIAASHGHSGLMPWSLGGTANKIVHGATIPILLLRAAAFNKKRGLKDVFGKILLPLDGSVLGEKALPYAVEIAKRLKSEVAILCVVESGQRVHTIGGLNFIRFSEQQVKNMEEELSAYLEGAVKKFGEQNVDARGVLRFGNAAEEIIKYSKEANVRLVVMSSHGKSGMREWVFGSVSNKVLHSGKAHLLLIKSA